MSTQTTTPETVSCEYCPSEFSVDAGIRGSYCSTECFHREKGDAAIGELERDHRVCGTCFQKRSEVEYPSAEWVRDNGSPPEAFIGFEYTTRYVSESHGMKHCTCGTVEHSSTNEFLRLWFLRETAMNLYVRLKELYEQDKVAHRPDGVTLMEALRESKCDWALATGRCIYQE